MDLRVTQVLVGLALSWASIFVVWVLLFEPIFLSSDSSEGPPSYIITSLWIAFFTTLAVLVNTLVKSVLLCRRPVPKGRKAVRNVMLVTACAAGSVYCLTFVVEVHPWVKLAFIALGCFSLSAGTIFACSLCAREFGLAADESTAAAAAADVVDIKNKMKGDDVPDNLTAGKEGVEVIVDVLGDEELLLSTERSGKV